MKEHFETAGAEMPTVYGSVQTIGGPEWREEIQDRINRGKERLKPHYSSEFFAYARRVLNDRFEPLVGPV